jgi:hypothetical protein
VSLFAVALHKRKLKLQIVAFISIERGLNIEILFDSFGKFVGLFRATNDYSKKCQQNINLSYISISNLAALRSQSEQKSEKLVHETHLLVARTHIFQEAFKERKRRFRVLL